MSATQISGERVVLYERRRLVREGIAALLEQQGACVDACTEPRALANLFGEEAAVIVLGVDNADEALWSVLQRHSGQLRRARSIGVVTSCDAVNERRVRRVGIQHVVQCDAGFEGLREALTAPALRTAVVGSVASRLRPRAVVPLMANLTAREREVMRFISLGLTASEIAGKLGITSKTVENHKQRIYRKLDVQSQSQAVGVALRYGLLQTVRPFDRGADVRGR